MKRRPSEVHETCQLPLASAWGSTVSFFTFRLSFKKSYWEGIDKNKQGCNECRII